MALSGLAEPQRATRAARVLGTFSRDQRYALAFAGEQAAFDVDFVGSRDDLSESHGADVPDALLIDASSRDAERVALDLRAQAPFTDVPILALTREVGDLAFAEVFAWGGDDVVSLGAPRGLTARLRALPTSRGTKPRGNGRAVVADGDPRGRIVLGRVLRSAGWDVTFAVTAADACELPRRVGASLVVMSADLGPTRQMIDSAQSGGPPATFIVLAPPRSLGELRRAFAPAAVVTDAFAPPENVLFLANELRGRPGNDLRASTRLLFGTTVAFRGAGRDRDDHGYTYNISSGGLYVRTLAPPEDDLVWLELTPPRSDRRVRIEARVAWRRGFGPALAATVPPGFGVQITDGTATDLAAWRGGYEEFARALA